MGAAQQRLLAWLACCLAISAVQAQPVVLSSPVTFLAIQTAINGLSAGDTTTVRVIEIPEDEVVDFGVNSLVVNKVGVTLRSAGPRPVTFQSASALTTTSVPGCADEPNGIPFVQVCNTGVAAPSAPITFENIIFKNTLNWPANKGAGPNKGIGIYAYPGTSSRPCRVTNCQFINLWGQPPNVAGVGIEFTTATPLSDNWIVSANTFTGTRQGVYINGGNDNIVISDNSFTRFFTCVRVGNNDISTGITITKNSMVGGWTPADQTPPTVVQAIALSAAASSATADRNWLIENNDISGVNQAIEIRGSNAAPSFGFVGLNINTNSIDADYGCPLCFAVVNTAPTNPPPLGNNWWGANPPDPNKFVSTSLNIPSPSTTLNPWIANFTGKSCGAGQPGFCPSDVIDSNVVVPDITAVTADPNYLSPGQPFGLTVTLAAPGVSFGTLRAVSNPAGITCQSAELTGAVTEVTLPCTAPPAASTSATAAAALQQDQQQPNAAQQDPAMPAAAELEADASTQNTPPLNPTATTKSYTITAIASADRTDTQSTTVTVCQNTPWPFRAAVEGCAQCGYNCATGVFSCASCKCHCPKAKHPYHNAERPGADKPYYEPDSDPYHKPVKRAYEDSPYADPTHADYTPREYHREEERPYAVPEHRAYAAPDDRPLYPAPEKEEEGSYGQKPDGYDGGSYHAQEQKMQEARSGDESYRAERPSYSSGQDREEEYPAGRAHEHRVYSEPAHEEEQYSSQPQDAAILWQPYFSYADKPYEADCSAETSKECVCGPAPLTVTAGCDSVVYNPCTNTLSCSSSGGYY